MNDELTRYLTKDEIHAICEALEKYKRILNDGDLLYGSTYFRIMADQRERAFDKLIDKIRNGRII